MKDKSIADPFYQQIQKEIDKVEDKANRYIFSFYFIRITQILLTGAITVLSGFAKCQICMGIDKGYVLILGVIVTAITAIDTLFQIETKKNTYKLVLFEFRFIRSEFVYKYIQGNRYVDAQSRDELYEKYKKANTYSRDLIGGDSE